MRGIIKFNPPPGIDITVRCVECIEPLQVKELLTVATLRDLLMHINTFDHEIVVSARRKP